MTYTDLVKKPVLSQPVYEPGKPIEIVAKEFGLEVGAIVKLASNENPLGPSPKALDAACKAMESINLYPEGGGVFLRTAIAEARAVDPAQVILGNGSNEIFELLGHLFLGPGDEVVFGAQAFIVYKLVTLLFGATPVEIPMPNYSHDLEAMREAVTERTRLVFIPTPNNPTGTCVDEEALKAFILALPDHVVAVIDEAYAEYLNPEPDFRELFASGSKVLCTRTFSKIYGLAGLRIGYAYGDPELVDLLHRVRQPFNTNAVAQAAALGALNDLEWVDRCRKDNETGLQQLTSGLNALGHEVVPSRANFVLASNPTPGETFQFLQRMGVIVRPVEAYGLPGHLRISVGTPEQNASVLTLIKEMEMTRRARPDPTLV